MPARLTSSTFIGRERQLGELEDLLETVAGGRAELAFVTGESGMGKSRLLDELAVRARERGARVLSGDCVELGDGELPYAPIVSALRPLARAGDPALDALGAARAELAQLLPELGEARAPRGGETAQARMFELLLGLLERLGRDAPTVLMLEDVHWADRSTRDFLVFLSRAVCRERVLAVATYRSDELHRRHPLRPVLAELERSERVRRIALEPFTYAELAGQLRDILGDEPDPALVARLWARSEGNPLFAEELLAAGGDGSAELPPTLRDALILRVEALSAEAQEALRVVAAGERLDHATLEEVVALDRRTLRDALREAVAHGLLTHDEDGRYQFRHALLREAVADDLLPGERAELHRALAAALERQLDGRPESASFAAAVAHHHAAAGDHPRALAAAVRAADASARIHAHGEAAALFERALELWDRVDEPEALAGRDRIALLQAAAQEHQLSDHYNRARSLIGEALDRVDREAEPLRAAALLERLGRARWNLGKSAEALEAYAEALALLPPEPTPERATVLGAQGGALMLAARYGEAGAKCTEAIAVARTTGTRQAEDHALNTLGTALGMLGQVDAGERALRAALALAREDGRLDAALRAYVNLADALYLGGRPREARELADEGLEEIGDGHQCRWLTLQASEIAFHLGDWAQAERYLVRAGDRRAPGNDTVLYLLRRGELHLGRGEHDAARVALEDARDRAAPSIEPQWHGPIAALLAELHRRERRLDAARDAIRAGLERLDDGRVDDVLRVGRVAAAGVAVEADVARRARDLGRDDEAAAAAARAGELLAIARRADAARPSGALPETAAHLAVAEAEHARAAGRADPAAWAEAAACWEATSHRYLAALARWREAEAQAERGDREGAEAAARAAGAAAEAIGARWLAGELDALARRARLRVAPEPAGGNGGAPAEPADAADELGLTAREREVLGLLAQGRTNRQIGEALFMAEKTASVHVSRILAKLDVRTRTEAAAVAHRLGLAA